MSNKQAELEAAKSEMKKYRDLYGEKLLHHKEIDSCKNYLQLEQIIELHREHIIEMVSDAESSLDNLKSKIFTR